MAPDGYSGLFSHVNMAFSKPKKRFSIKLIDQSPESEYHVSVVKL
jgi:hypothetical protein